MHEVPIAPQHPDGFSELIEQGDLLRYRRALADAADGLEGHTWWHVNSTAEGGGVAELLHALLGYVVASGIDARWMVIEGDPAFFEVTKRIHNRLHGSPGDGGELGPRGARRLRRGAGARTGAVRRSCNGVTSSCCTTHRRSDSRPSSSPEVRTSSGSATSGSTRRTISRGRHGPSCSTTPARPRPPSSPGRRTSWDGLDPSRVSIIPPCIDAGSPKNVPIEHPTVEAVLAAAGVIEAPVGDPTVRLADGSTIRVAREAVMLEEAPVPATAPLVVQISRWDRLKDPIGVLTGFATEVPLDTGAHLVLAGPQVDTVSDDPEGAEVLAEVSDGVAGLLPHDRARTHLASLPVHDLTENAVVVNALQRRADVVVQKSVAEGFGLTVTEAMWKERPVVGSRLGGIAEQIEHGKSGLLVDPADLTAFGEALSMLLRDEQFAAEIGHGARQRVRSRFLAPHYLSAHLELALRVAGRRRPLSQCSLTTVPASLTRRSVRPECTRSPVTCTASSSMRPSSFSRVSTCCSDSSGVCESVSTVISGCSGTS